MKSTDFLEECLAQALQLALQLFLLVRNLLRLAFLDQELSSQILELAGERRRGPDERRQ